MNKKTLVLGASPNPNRYANRAVNRLTSNGHEVVPIGIREGEIGSIKIQTSLDQIEGIDTITLYLNPMRQKAYYDDILDLEPRRVIFNPGTENPELVALLKKNNIEVEIACTLVLLATGEY